MLRVVGEPRAWSRDLALVGGVTGVLAPAACFGWMVSPPFCLLAGPAGAAVGGALGAAMPALLDRVRGRAPIPLLVLLLGPLLGAAWGGATGLLAGLGADAWHQATGSPTILGGPLAVTGFIFGAAAGSVQLGWLWFPYTFQTVRRGRRWPVLLAALLVAPLTALLALATNPLL